MVMRRSDASFFCIKMQKVTNKHTIFDVWRIFCRKIVISEKRRGGHLR